MSNFKSAPETRRPTNRSLATQPSPSPLSTSVHALVLSSASPNYFRPRLDRWTTDCCTRPSRADADASVDIKKHRPGSDPQPDTADADQQEAALYPFPEALTLHRPEVLTLTCYPGEPHTVPEAVLKHAYTGQLPDDNTVLTWMVWRADYLDMKTTVDACLTKLQQLADSKQLSVSDTLLFTQLPDLQTPDTRDSVDTLIKTLLPQHFGDTRKLVTTPELLQAFVQLPLSIVEQWNDMACTPTDTVSLDHENTLVVLLTAWYNHQQPTPSQGAQQQLSHLVLLGRLSVSFHVGVMHRLKWFNADDGTVPDHAAMHALMHAIPADKHYAQQQLRCRSIPATSSADDPVTEHRLEVERSTVSDLWAHRPGAVWSHPQTLYCGGVCYTVDLSVRRAANDVGQEVPHELTFSIRSQWPEPLVAHGLKEQVAYPSTGITWGFKSGRGDGWAYPCTPGIVTGSPSGRWVTVPTLSISSEEQLWAALQDGVVVTLKDPM